MKTEGGVIMAETDPEPKFLENFGFLITYRCQVACPHCVIEAGPNRKEQMKIPDAYAWMSEVGSYRDGYVKGACFTGGEPFYDLGQLQQLCQFALSCGLLPTVVTNAFWAESMEGAIAALKSIPELRVISVSADVHHQAQIPFDRVRNALLATKELGRFYHVSVCTEDKEDPEYREILEQLRCIVKPDRITTAITAPAGRSLQTMDPSRWPLTEECPAGACTSADTPVVFPDGRVMACLGPVINLPEGHPLILGNLNHQPLEVILDTAEVNVVLHFLRVWGPGRLYNLLQAKGLEARLPKRFIRGSVCNLCYSLLADPALCLALQDIGEDVELTKETAYARQFYLQETEMVRRLDAAGMLAE